ncbi:MAG: tol-pal system protein [Marinibacterium sp.]|nr:tol-pal system protein [Marinibacterium sp.]
MAQQAGHDQTLADIRQELSVLYVEIQRLKRDLSTSGAPQTTVGGSSVLDRVNAIEAELQRLTAQTEQLDHRVREIVRDGTNRIGDLEFRLVELEGGDVSTLGETSTLGGDPSAPAPATPTVPVAPAAPDVELAVGEQADFDTADAARQSGDMQAAADGYAAFREAYPASPLMPRAMLGQGQALQALGQTRPAARAYLDSFSADSGGATAPAALVGLGTMLGALGQVDQACITLGEVPVRFPTSPEVSRAEAARQTLGCS